MQDKFQLVLASGSPRRKEFIESLGIPFHIITKEIEEVSSHSEPKLVVEDIAFQKGMAVLELPKTKSLNNPLVVSSDTIVCIEDKILGKPESVDEAREMLLELSGRTHQVLSAVNYLWADNKITFSEKTNVTFDKISPSTLDYYLSTGESMDKAGAYGIQKYGLLFVSKVEGSYSNVVGFPLNEFIKSISKTFECENWRSLFL